jgi:hypothetical protein
MSQTSTALVRYCRGNDERSGIVAQTLLGEIQRENIETVRSKRGSEQLIYERWPKLKKRAQRERNLQKLVAVFEEIDDLLFNIEMKVAAEAGRTDSMGDMGSRSGLSRIWGCLIRRLRNRERMNECLLS